jgi:ABC-2 type transport system ATP-binding protein
VTTLVKASNLSKRFGNVVALDGVDLEIPEGRIVGLIGPNGAGKTTALKALLGLTSFSGELEVMGLDPRRERHRIMQDVCFIADVAVLPRWLKVRQVLRVAEGLHPRFSPERAEKLLAASQVRLDSRVGQLSKGMVTQLHLALVMAIEAKLLVLDEPTIGLDILYRKDFYTTLLNDYFDEGRTILVTTHQVEEIEHILTDVLFINQGRIVLDESMDQIGERFAQVAVTPEQADAARDLDPLYEQDMFGRKIFLFQDRSPQQLSGLGETRVPGIADLFVAKIKGAAA